jgi:GNAT superfamily N-acetyltransferase
LKDSVQLVEVDNEQKRQAARALIFEYLDFINETALQNYNLSFDIRAMVDSDIDDKSKFYPPTGRFYLVSYENSYVGVGCLKRLGPGVGEIQRMYIQPHARGIGAGRLLVEQLIADAGHLGYTILRLESLKALDAAHTLYRSVGFVEIDPYADNSMKDYQPPETIDTYRSCAVFMELRLRDVK